MTHGGAPAGYTIIEVMIFLAITSVLFIGAMTSIGGKQASVQFSQATRDAQTKIQDIISNVSTGFYPNNNDFTCTVPNRTTAASRPQFILPVVGQSTQGSSSDCIFLGKVMQLAVQDADASGTKYNAISVAARRLGHEVIAKEVVSLDEANPTVIVKPDGNTTVESAAFQFGLRVTKVVDAGTGTQYGAIAFFSTLPYYAEDSSDLTSGAQRVSFGGIPGTVLNQSLTDANTQINNISDSSTPTGPGRTTIKMNPSEGIVICLADNNNRKAMLTVGGASGQATVRLDIDLSYNKVLCA